VKLAISAGAGLPVALEREIFQSHGLKVHNFYGASECGGICYDASDTPRESDEEVGTPLDGVKIAIDGDSRLVVTGGAVGETYWPQADPSLAHGQFRPGDRVELRHGRVFLQGRHGDIINIAGQKVAPEVIEQAILRYPGARECVVFGAPDPTNLRAETIVASVAGEIDLAALKNFVASALPSWQVPRQWRLVPALADPARGKISRAQWRERFLSGT
jgi:acyl-coenzyme A synthetase/AMP-(fatty) acid ligase